MQQVQSSNKSFMVAFIAEIFKQKIEQEKHLLQSNKSFKKFH